MASDGIFRWALAAHARRLPTTQESALPVAEGPRERRNLLLLMAAAPLLVLGGCDSGDDDEDGDDDDD
jgi:hypothetical protein